MKRIDFQKSEQDMATLAEILRHPIMRVAIEIVKAESVGLPDPIAGVDYADHVAVCGAFTAGAFRAFEKLESLTRPPGMFVGNMPAKQDLYANAAKEKMREQRVYTDEEIDKI